MSINDSCIVDSEKGLGLARNGELERLLHQLIDGFAADHCRAEMHSAKDVLDGLREKLVGRLEHLERLDIGLSVGLDHELRLNLTRDARALEDRRILRLRAV